MDQEKLRIAALLIDGIRKTYPDIVPASGLSLTNDMYHKSTSLYNEGVWHNCVFGVDNLLLSQCLSQQQEGQSERSAFEKDESQKTAASLWHLNFDAAAGLLNQRTQSSYWDHNPEIVSKLYKPQFYSTTSEKRSISNAFASFFYGMLGHRTSNQSFLEKHRILVRSLLLHLWDPLHSCWKPSMSSGAAAAAAPTPSVASPHDSKPSAYFRAVDQALCLLSILSALGDGTWTSEEMAQMKQIAKTTVHSLLTTFGYDVRRDKSTAKSYMYVEPEFSHLVQPRFLWQDIWVALSLLKYSDYEEDSEKKEETRACCAALMDDLIERYRNPETGLFWNMSVSKECGERKDPLVVYTGDNSLMMLLLQSSAKRGIQSALLSADEFTEFYLKYIRETLWTPRGLLLEADLYKIESYWAVSETILGLLWTDLALK